MEYLLNLGAQIDSRDEGGLQVRRQDIVGHVL